MKINLLDTEGPDIRVEIIPLIDVIFCILTFFILAAVNLTRQQAINLDLPKASTGAAQTQELLLVSIDPTGQTYIDKQPISRDQLYQLLMSYIRTKPAGLVVLNASPLVSYNDVIQVLDLLRSVGGDRVALATQPANKPTLTPQTPGTNLQTPVNPANPINPVNPGTGESPPMEGLPVAPTESPAAP